MAKSERFDEAVSKWLEESAPARVSERVLTATFERTRRTGQHVGWRAFLGRPEMIRFVTALGSAAVLVVIAAVAVNFYVNQQGIGGPPTASPSASPTFTVATPSPVDGSLPVGPYVLNPGRVHGEDRVTVTIPAPGWFEGPFTASITKDLGGGDRVTVVVVSGDHYKVPRDICHWQTPPDDQGDRIADTLDDLAAYLMEQTYDTSAGPLTREFAPLETITLDGHPGQLIRSVAPLDPSSALECDRDPSEGQFSQDRVFCSLQDRDGWECLLAHLEPGVLDSVWIVDRDQAWFRVVAASYPTTTSSDLLAEMNSIVESITFR